HRASELLERHEGIIDDNALRLNLVRIAAHFFRGHQGSDGAASKGRSNVIVSIVTRSVDGHEQLAGTYRARINRDTGQPGHRIESRTCRRRKNSSYLCNRPPHKCLSSFPLSPYPRVRLVLTGSRGSSLIRSPPAERAVSRLASGGSCRIHARREPWLTGT